MNRRLLLALYDRSGLGAYLPVDYKGHELKVDEHMEKFAEMIVRECVEVVKWTPSQFSNDEYVKNIQEHFGVEDE